MKLLDKIDGFYKKSQAAAKPSQIILNTINTISRQIAGRSDIPEDEKRRLTENIQKACKDRPDHIDASWSMCLASTLDNINSETSSAETTELKEFYRKLFQMVIAAWEGIEQLGHKAHVDKPMQD